MLRSRLFKKIAVVTVCTSLIGSMVGCSSTKETSKEINGNDMTIEEITKLAKEEGKVVSVGMPDTWANWKDTWKDIKEKHGLEHSDTDMSSAEEISKFEAEKDKPTSDIGDVGIAFGPIAEKKGVTMPYKTSYWDEIPEWAKDEDGDWIVGYTGSISIISNKKLIKDIPKSWDDLLKGDYKVAVGDVTKAAQAQAVVLSAAMAFGGDESNIEPGLEFFAKLAKQGRLSMADPSVAGLEKGEVAVGLAWDFNSLGYRDQINKEDFEVYVPKDGSLISGYATIINKYAPNPHAAMLTREYILSDEGQINLAKGYARPIRSNVELPKEVKGNMLSDDQYKNVKPIKDFKVWEETAKKLPQLWQEKVIIYVK